MSSISWLPKPRCAGFFTRGPPLSRHAIAAPVVKWSVQVETADELGPILQRAFKIANEAPAGPVFVALPIDVMEQETAIPPGKPGHSYTATRPDPAGIAAMAKLLAASKSPAVVRSASSR